MIVRHRTPLAPFDRSFDRAFEQLTNSFFDSRRQVGPIVDGAWHDDQFVLTVDLPGVPADAVTVEVAGSTLTLGAQTDSMEWQRTLRLSNRLDPETVSANHVDGRLTVRIGTFAEPRARQVEIETSPAPAAIEATGERAEEHADESADESTD